MLTIIISRFVGSPAIYEGRWKKFREIEDRNWSARRNQQKALFLGDLDHVSYSVYSIYKYDYFYQVFSKEKKVIHLGLHKEIENVY